MTPNGWERFDPRALLDMSTIEALVLVLCVAVMIGSHWL